MKYDVKQVKKIKNYRHTEHNTHQNLFYNDFTCYTMQCQKKLKRLYEKQPNDSNARTKLKKKFNFKTMNDVLFQCDEKCFY